MARLPCVNICGLGEGVRLTLEPFVVSFTSNLAKVEYSLWLKLLKGMLSRHFFLDRNDGFYTPYVLYRYI